MVTVVNFIYPSFKDGSVRLTTVLFKPLSDLKFGRYRCFAGIVFEFWPFLPVPFTFKVKNMDILLIFLTLQSLHTGALYELNITSTVPLGTMDIEQLFTNF